MRALRFLLLDGALTAAFGLAVSATFADTVSANHPLLSDRYRLTLGGFYSRNTTEASVSAPLPVINLYGSFALTDSWAIRLRADWLSLDNGGIRDTSIDVHYQPWRNLGLGFGMRNLMIDLDIDSSDWQGQARINFQGPTAVVSASF